jgi:hypothetical protein
MISLGHLVIEYIRKKKREREKKKPKVVTISKTERGLENNDGSLSSTFNTHFT